MCMFEVFFFNINVISNFICFLGIVKNCTTFYFQPVIFRRWNICICSSYLGQLNLLKKKKTPQVYTGEQKTLRILRYSWGLYRFMGCCSLYRFMGCCSKNNAWKCGGSWINGGLQEKLIWMLWTFSGREFCTLAFKSRGWQ